MAKVGWQKTAGTEKFIRVGGEQSREGAECRAAGQSSQQHAGCPIGYRFGERDRQVRGIKIEAGVSGAEV